MTRDEPCFARVAATIGDPTRARMLAALLDGTLLTAGELARAVGIGASTASAHLAALVDAQLVAVRSQGRHRYFRLADADVAHALEALAAVSERDTVPWPGSGRGRSWSRDDLQPLRHARTCFGHLAGRLGVRLHDALIERSVVVSRSDRLEVADPGGELRRLDFDVASVTPGRRGVAYPCIDWSERRDHFAGPLAVALLEHFVARRWLVRTTGRALSIGPMTSPPFDDLMGSGRLV